MLMDIRNPESITWVRKKGNNRGPKVELKSNQVIDPRYDKHFTAKQDFKTGYTIIEECEKCKKLEEDENTNIENQEIEYEYDSYMPESCNTKRNVQATVWSCDLINQKKKWKNSERIEIPIDCRSLEEESKDQIL